MQTRLLPLRLSFRIFGDVDYDEEPIEFKICNFMSLVFYALQTIYGCLLLYRLVRKTDRKPHRSKSFILATIILVISSLQLTVLFSIPWVAIKAQNDTKNDLDSDFYLILCRDLPFSLNFIAHLIILNQYFELTLQLDVLVKMRSNWAELGNKITARKQCLNACSIIICALVVAHFLDKGFYTIRLSSTQANFTTSIFSITMHGLVDLACVMTSFRFF